jgi:hypothetical protein
MIDLYMQGYSKTDKKQIGPAYNKGGLVKLCPGRHISHLGRIEEPKPAYL